MQSDSIQIRVAAALSLATGLFYFWLRLRLLQSYPSSIHFSRYGYWFSLLMEMLALSTCVSILDLV